jgi:hypothetical protein
MTRASIHFMREDDSQYGNDVSEARRLQRDQFPRNRRDRATLREHMTLDDYLQALDDEHGVRRREY